ncbi:MAG: metallophosphoesterase family protein [Myxococcales bacterium]|nr:metallophosphoesterase family protein [Myxococcales bacterium]
MIRRAGVVGDVHHEHEHLLAAIELFGRLGSDHLLCVGDLPDGPGDADDLQRCCELLQQHGFITVGGNHERWLLDDMMRDLPHAILREELDPETLQYLQQLPLTVELQTAAGAALLCHGLGEDDMSKVVPHDHAAALAKNEALQSLLAKGQHRFVINGHSHRFMAREIEGLTILNAGTLLRSAEPGCLWLDFEARIAQWHAFGASDALELASEQPF